MPVDVMMPKLSDTMEEGKILRWVKKPGDRVAIGDVLAEVETDKANMELEAYDEGVLAELRVEEGESAPVGAVIAVLAEAGEATAPPSAEKPAEPAPAGERPASPSPKPEPEPAPAPREPRRPTLVRREAPEPRSVERVKASPLARRIAAEKGVDLAAIAGSGPGGRIVEKDVEAAARAGGAAPEPKRAAEPRPAPTKPSAPEPVAGGRVELSRIRRTTAKRMGEAKREIPHFYASADIAMDEAVRLKEALVALEAEYADLTYTHILVKAAGLALRRVPELNGSYDGDAMVLHDAVNVGVATAIDDGLVVPVIRNCDREPLAAIARQARGLLERARSGRFAGDDLSGGTFTLSNLGMFPVSQFAAVINPPQAAILAVGAIREVPVVQDGAVVPGRTMTVTLSCDHRIIDGVLAARFLRELKTLLENPLALVL
jgi:pyruvate dehydrogenase E2 component (dihydrolipoamide acetyltransferase)